MSNNNSFKNAVKLYLDTRAANDELFAVTYKKENKSLDECCNYILSEAKKRGNAVCMSDDEVYGLAIHYYDEDGLKVEKASGCSRASVSTPKVNLTNEDKKAAHEAAIKRLAEEQYQSLRKKPAKKKETPEVQQMSLF